ncbi:MAG TPA: hypothetical protein V6C69_00695 [Trichormus sp.]|jgi:hypothetical protein
MTDDKKRKAEEAAADKQQLQERILRGVRPDTSEATGKWVVDLKSGTTGEIEVPLQFDEKTAGKYPDDMRSWVDKMFDEFQRYLSEYNKYQSDHDMLLNSERPEFVKATTAGSTKYRTTKEIPTYFQGHLYSRKWAMLIRGEEMAVKAWVLPVDYLIGFDTREADFKPYFVMKAARNDRGIYIWHVDAVPISYEALNAITKSMFSALVRATRDEFKEGEQFRLAAEEVQEQSKMDTEQFIQRYTIPPGSLKAQFLQKPAVSTAPPMPQQPSQYPGFSTPMASGQMPQLPQTPFQQPAYQQPPPFQAPAFPQPNQQPPAPTPAPAPAPAPIPLPVMPTPTPAATVPFSSPQAPPSGQPSDMLLQALEENYKAILLASQSASHAMSNQLDLLTKIGMAAMQAQNMEGVSQVMTRSKAVKQIRDKIDEFIEELNAIKSSK